MKKRKLIDRIRYLFDYALSKGPIATCILLFVTTGVIVCIIGIIAHFLADDGGFLYQIWMTLMHTLDTGNLAAVSTDNLLYLLMMSLATLCGMFLTSILIGIIASGVEQKLSELRKGTSVVQETGHTVIVGFDENIYTILRELILANANQKHGCIVVLGELPKDEMEDQITSHIPDTGNTRIICRSGKLCELYALERCSVETAKSVIINVPEDERTIKVLLALSACLKGKILFNPHIRFITALQDNNYIEIANIAAEGRAEIIYTKDAIARIIANTCRQHGLSQVFTELFNFSGDELYFEHVPQLEGKTFKDATLSFSNAVVVGLFSKGNVQLNPPMSTVIGKGDQLVLLEEDDGIFNYHPPKIADSTHISDNTVSAAEASDHLVILGSNEKLPIILTEYDRYVRLGTEVMIIDDDLDSSSVVDVYDRLNVTVCPQPITRELLWGFLEHRASNILLLNDDSRNVEDSDTQTLLWLILLRDIADKSGKHFTITTEMRSVENQRLAAQARVDDFVIGSNFASLMMAQLSENPDLAPLIADLLDEEGSELYMKPAAEYVATGVPVDGYTLTESAARQGEIYVGYRLHNAPNVVINPDKNTSLTFIAQDQLIVIAQN